jgi:hypothetical protein
MPYRRKRKRKDGTYMVAYYSDIRERAGGAATGQRIRKLLPGVTNMTDARKAEERVRREMEEGEASPLVTDFLLTTYLQWACENKARPDIDDAYVRAACESAHVKGRTLAEFSLIQAEGYRRELRAALNRRDVPRTAGDINARLAVLSRLPPRRGFGPRTHQPVPARLAARLPRQALPRPRRGG